MISICVPSIALIAFANLDSSRNNANDFLPEETEGTNVFVKAISVLNKLGQNVHA